MTKRGRIIGKGVAYPWAIEQRGLSWYLVWEGPGKRRPKRVGPVKVRGRNYFDVAVAEAERRNRMHSP